MKAQLIGSIMLLTTLSQAAPTSCQDIAPQQHAYCHAAVCCDETTQHCSVYDEQNGVKFYECMGNNEGYSPAERWLLQKILDALNTQAHS